LLGQKTYTGLTLSEKKLYEEHIVFGQPDNPDTPVYVRQGYVMKYNKKFRIPVWVAYHIVPDYLNTPPREGKFCKFTFDPELNNPVKNSDYVGTGFAKGHMAPYFAMGGDRDKDNMYADLNTRQSDNYDEMTVFQANYLSNIAPQNQITLNGPGGPWYALETVIRKTLVGKLGMELNLVVGGIISDTLHYKTLSNKKKDTGIAIPDKFFQVLLTKDENGEYITGGFLFPHVKTIQDLPYKDLIKYLVPVDSIEELSGLDFFNRLEKPIQVTIEKKDNMSFWNSKFEKK
jgi:endonuclease G